METLPTLDAHAHLAPSRTPTELASSGAVLAMTVSLDEANLGVARREPWVAWGVGCHPRNLRAQQAFDPDRFGELVERAAFAGEIGLDKGSRVPLELQLRTFRRALRVLAGRPRMVSIHSYDATGLVLEELKRTRVAVPVLHWWTGNVTETWEAVALGARFSIHSAVARQSKFRTSVPLDRLLIESDHGYSDPPAAIPCRVEWVEHLVAQQRGLSVEQIRLLVWRNLGRTLGEAGALGLLPPLVAAAAREVCSDASAAPASPFTRETGRG
ncbi:MAG: TatD family hydrolase [bacterium]|nr:TatD family hydrolase [bacterium]